LVLIINNQSENSFAFNLPYISHYKIVNSIQKENFPGVFAILFINLMALQYCSVTHSGTSTDIKSDSPVITPKIIFLNYSVKKNKSNGEIEIRLIDKMVTEGKLKINNIGPEIPKPGDLKCITLDEHLTTIDSLIVPDPLNVTVESVNESNALFKKEIAKDSAQFSVRLQLTEKIYAIGIKKTINSGNQNTYLLLTKLKQ
jgi:hypothetical protein